MVSTPPPPATLLPLAVSRGEWTKGREYVHRYLRISDLDVPFLDFKVTTAEAAAGSEGDEEEEDTTRSHKALDDVSLGKRTATTTPASPQQASKLTTPGSTAGTNIGASTSAGDLEAEDEQQGAFNPETGEINWDCPCLGGMAHGPCGEEFKSAFSCFVYSTAEPKGVDCIEKFKTMQDCFRKVWNLLPLLTTLLFFLHRLPPPLLTCGMYAHLHGYWLIDNSTPREIRKSM